MKRHAFLLFAACLFGFASLPISAGLKIAPANSFFVSLPEAGKISIQAPEKWQHTVAQPEEDGPSTATVKITPPDDFPLMVVITLLDLSMPGTEEQKKAFAEKSLTNSLGALARDSVEKKVNLRPLPTKLGDGTYAVITDASLVGKDPLPKDNFLKVSSGQIVSENCIVIFTVFSNDTESDQYRQAMKIISEGLTGR